MCQNFFRSKIYLNYLSLQRVDRKNNMSVFVEENVVKNRLLFDGDGNGDDRRLNMLLKLTTKWGHATNPNGDPEEDIKVKLLIML